MARWSRLFFSALSLASIATHARAAEVSLQLVSATYVECNDSAANGETCSSSFTATLLPAIPEGPGSVIDIDAAGVVIRAVLQLREFSLDGMSVPQVGGHTAALAAGLLPRRLVALAHPHDQSVRVRGRAHAVCRL